jgi:uncharacterized protein HemX
MPMGASEIAAWGTAAAGLIAALASGYGLWRTKRAEAEDTEEQVDTRKARNRQKLRREESDYIIAKWQELYENLNGKVDGLVKNEARCQKRLVRVETSKTMPTKHFL